MTTITVCTTCRNEATRDSKEGYPTGEDFHERVQAAIGTAPLRLRGVACLMGCKHGCNVAISEQGKLTYVLGRFDGTGEDAAALVDYATKFAESDSGAVPFRQWPQGVRGHFVARVPPLEPEAG